MSILDVERPETESPPEASPGPEFEPSPERIPFWLRRSFSYVGTPLLVAVSVGLLYGYVQGRELDSIERRILTARNLRTAAVEHIDISLWATVITLAVAIPLGIVLTRPWAKRFTPAFVGAANIGQGVPAIGTIVLAFLWAGSHYSFFRNGRIAAITGLAIYAILPVLRATMVGLQQVAPEIIKAARGMGLGRRQVLRQIELPLSVPIMATGVRTALVLTVSTAPLAAFVGGGTFGRLILAGQAQTRPVAVVTGAVLAASLALLADWVGGIVEDKLRPRGL